MSKDVRFSRASSLYIYKRPQKTNLDLRHRKVLYKIIKAIEKRMKTCDQSLLFYPYIMLNSIIFDSKTKPWWIYISLLRRQANRLYKHSINVAIISLVLAIKLGYNEEELRDLGLGALLHDIGKLLVPKTILQKSEKLSENERAYILKHCEYGMHYIKPLSLRKECTDIISNHHERLDGSGYPRGLKEDQICLNAKIVMIADVVDTITAGRNYKKPQEMSAAIKILKSEEKKYSKELVSLLEQIF